MLFIGTLYTCVLFYVFTVCGILMWRPYGLINYNKVLKTTESFTLVMYCKLILESSNNSGQIQTGYHGRP